MISFSKTSFCLLCGLISWNNQADGKPSFNGTTPIIPIDSTKRQIDKFYFLIHAFCYAEMMAEDKSDHRDSVLTPYYEREKRCADLWRAQVKKLSATEALVVIPWSGKANGPVHRFNAFADSLLGDRFFLLDRPDPYQPLFWQDCQDSTFAQTIVKELQDALVRQKEKWNKEELFTTLHAIRCCQQLVDLASQRKLHFDPATLQSEAWGASFEGCVTKYGLSIRRILKLRNPIAIAFDKTVPDALFLLNASLIEHPYINDHLQLFLFYCDAQLVAYYIRTTVSLAEEPAFVRIKAKAGEVTVLSKQGILLWPLGQEYHLPKAPMGHYEPPQVVVKSTDDGLLVPVSSGYVYRLAKAPAFIFASSGLTIDRFREILLGARACF